MPKKLNVLFLASEADPFVKVGGLGDVAGSLPIALRALPSAKLDVRLVIPFHNVIRIESFPMHREAEFNILRDGVEMPVEVFSTQIQGVTVYLISTDAIRRSEAVYDADPLADSEKYISFSLAALALALHWLVFRPPKQSQTSAL